MQVDIRCNHMLLGSGDDGELKIAKRPRDEFEVNEVSCMLPSAKIHAVAESLSPMKPSQSNSCSVPLFELSHSSTITLRLLFLHFINMYTK